MPRNTSSDKKRVRSIPAPIFASLKQSAAPGKCPVRPFLPGLRPWNGSHTNAGAGFFFASPAPVD
jgi:hypothetical protein